MKFLALLFVAVSLAQGKVLLNSNNAYGYLESSIAVAEKRRELESQRIVGGVPAGEGQYPYQAGLLIDLLGFDGVAVCGAVLISPDRLTTASHCWFDGINQAWKYTVVLGSITLFSGGTRVETSVVVTHPNWFPALARNDIAVIYLPSGVSFSNNIAPVALPTGSEILEDFAGSTAIASGYGLTSDDGSITTNQFLSHVSLNVIANAACSTAFPLILQPTNICTSGIGGVGTCSGDSGGPLVITRDDRRILIGVTSFGSALGCQANLPAVFARITSYVDFLAQHQ